MENSHWNPTEFWAGVCISFRSANVVEAAWLQVVEFMCM
jgi:hypothetical protein